MLKINKKQEPSFLTEFKKKNKPKTWDDYNNTDIKLRLREFMLDNEQDGYCPYCETQITNDNKSSHIEHIKPRDKFSKDFQIYNNLITCCQNPNICGASKKNKYDEKFINPVLENPNEYLEYNLNTGEIVEKFDAGERYERAKCTIDLLNLNYEKLRDARKIFVLELDSACFEEDDFEYYKEEVKRFPSLIEFMKKDIFE
jgi:uncharacterized protein (TIGR02646 family)